jgi:hypothetical protein
LSKKFVELTKPAASEGGDVGLAVGADRKPAQGRNRGIEIVVFQPKSIAKNVSWSFINFKINKHLGALAAPLRRARTIKANNIKHLIFKAKIRFLH